MTALRKLNARGIAAFREYLQQHPRRLGVPVEPGPALRRRILLPHPATHRDRAAPFASKFDAAEYLSNALRRSKRPG